MIENIFEIKNTKNTMNRYIYYLSNATSLTIFCSSIIVIQRIRYNNYLDVKMFLIKDNANEETIKIYDDWLNKGFFYQLFKDPLPVHKD